MNDPPPEPRQVSLFKGSSSPNPGQRFAPLRDLSARISSFAVRLQVGLLGTITVASSICPSSACQAGTSSSFRVSSHHRRRHPHHHHQQPFLPCRPAAACPHLPVISPTNLPRANTAGANESARCSRERERERNWKVLTIDRLMIIIANLLFKDNRWQVIDGD